MCVGSCSPPFSMKREVAWYRHCGECFEHKCCARWCRSRITVFDFALVQGLPVCWRCSVLAGHHVHRHTRGTRGTRNTSGTSGTNEPPGACRRAQRLCVWCQKDSSRHMAPGKKKDSKKIPGHRKTTFTQAERQQCWRHHFGKCYEHRCYVRWCRNRIDVYNFHMGHNVPESKGGERDLRNLRPICANCNQGMGDRMTIDEWSDLHAPKQGWAGKLLSWVWG